MKNIVIALILILISMNTVHAVKYKVYVNDLNSYSDEELEVSSTENTKYQAKHNVKCNYGLQNGKIYGKIKVNNKQILKVNSKKLTNGMLSFVNISL